VVAFEKVNGVIPKLQSSGKNDSLTLNADKDSSQAYFKAAPNNRSIVEGHFKFHTADYVKNGILPMMLL